jgi:hypothetical protein
VYSWIWRHLPFGVPGKLIGSLLLVGALGAALWYGAFPIVDNHLPTNDGQITDNGGAPAGGDAVVPSPSR